MKERDYHLHDGKSGAAITVRVIPRSAKSEIGEILEDGTVTIRLKSADGEGKGNHALLVFLAEVLQVKQDQLEIVAGLTGADKLVTITDLDKEIVNDRIMQRAR